ncbi:MAG: hypothetical protein LBU51_00470 [Bacteroidales bacterium]|nr:hypothetical protein [Bacteroidales bacterium]
MSDPRLYGISRFFCFTHPNKKRLQSGNDGHSNNRDLQLNNRSRCSQNKIGGDHQVVISSTEGNYCIFPYLMPSVGLTAVSVKAHPPMDNSINKSILVGNT